MLSGTHRTRRSANIAEPPVFHGPGYPDERSFRVGRNALTHRFDSVFTHPLVEMGIVLGGSESIYLNGVAYPAHSGDAYFLDMCHPHRHDPVGTVSNLYVHVKYEALQALAPPDELTRLVRPFLLLQAGRVGPVIPRPRRLGRLLHEAWQCYNGSDPFGYALAWTRVVEAFVEIGRHCAQLPDQSVSVSELRQHEIVAKAVHFISANASQPLTLAQIASHCSLSPSRLSAVFSAVMRTSPIDYRNHVRISRAVEMLTATGRTVQEVAYECGFHSMAQFRILLRRYTGRTSRILRSQ